VSVSWSIHDVLSQNRKQITAKEIKMIIRKLRLQRAWSQEQLSECSGLSVRTIQRIERGQKPSVESLKSLAAVFEVNITDLTQEPNMNDNTATTSNPTQSAPLTHDEQEAIEYVKDIKHFYSQIVSYIGVISFLAFINWMFVPEFYWFIFPALGWGIGLFFQALSVFEITNFFSPAWEKKQVEKRLGRKL